MDNDVVVTIRNPESGDFVGQTTLTREPVTATAIALTEVTMLRVEREVLEDLVMRKPKLLHEIGRVIDDRRNDLRQALADEVGEVNVN